MSASAIAQAPLLYLNGQVVPTATSSIQLGISTRHATIDHDAQIRRLSLKAENTMLALSQTGVFR